MKAWGAVGVAGLVALELWRRTRPKRVFVSYDHSEDRQYRQLLTAWNANSHFSFQFDDRSPTEAIDSGAADVVKAALTRKMKEAKYLLVIVGAKSYTSKWIAWEIDRAKEPDVNLKLAAVKISRDYTAPAGLLNAGASWAFGFTRDGIVRALSEAKSGTQ